MKKKYETPEIEIVILNPEMDIITISGGDGTDPWNYEEKQKNDIIGL